MYFDVQSLKVGDEVGFGRGDYAHCDGFGIVTKINGYGHITVATKGLMGDGVILFDKHGQERGKQSYNGLILCDAAGLHARIEEREAQREASNRVHTLLNTIALHRCCDGSYVITPETKAELLALVEAL